MLTQSALTKDDKKQRLRKIIDKKAEEKIQKELSNPPLLPRMPPLERIKPKPPGPDSPLTKNQSQNSRTIKKQRWKSSQEIIAQPSSSNDGQKDQADFGITRNAQSSYFMATIEKKNR
jgi:hypothetical protein